MAKTVVLDAGHGGKDSGAVNGSHYEKDKVLKITLEVGSLLSKQGVSVIYTRKTDVDITLVERTSIEKKANANCCVSLHMDSATPTASGMTVWLHSQAPNSYVEWGKDMLNTLKQVGYISNRATEVNKGYVDNPKADFAWNRETNSPSMLLELGYITNVVNLNDFDNKYKLYAVAIAKSICKYIGVEYTEEIVEEPLSPTQYYKINKTFNNGYWNADQKGAFVYSNEGLWEAIDFYEKENLTIEYHIFDPNGKIVYPLKDESNKTKELEEAILNLEAENEYLKNLITEIHKMTE